MGGSGDTVNAPDAYHGHEPVAKWTGDGWACAAPGLKKQKIAAAKTTMKENVD
jgi:hypothetical protein